MSMEEFTDIALDHFMCPRNMVTIDSPNGEGTNGDPSCGDYKLCNDFSNKENCDGFICHMHRHGKNIKMEG